MASKVYGICGDGYSDLAALKAMGYVDIAAVVHAGAGPNPSFVSACNALNLSPIFQNGNDGVPGWGNNGTDVYYQNIAKAGYHAAGGESESNSEMQSIMRNLVFLNCGGDGLNPNDDIFIGNTKLAGASGHGIASYLETYNSSSSLWWDDTINAAVSAKQHGCKEVGLMIGGWMPVNAQPYIDLTNAIEAKGVPVAGFYLWWGFGINMNTTANKWATAIKALQAKWPPNMTPMKQRFSVTPPPPAKVTMASEIFRITSGANTDKFVVGSDKALWWKRNANAWISLQGIIYAGTMPQAAYVNGVLEVYVVGTDHGEYVRRLTGTALSAASWTAWVRTTLNLN